MVDSLSRSDRHVRTVSPPAPDATPDELLALAGAGDQRAFELLYGRVAAPILGMAIRVLGNRALAEEVTQEVLLELWRTASRYRVEKGSAISWALTMAHHRAVDRVRSERAVKEHEARTRFEAGYGRPFDEVAESAERHEEIAQVRRCLERLTELQRQAVTMAYYEGHTYTEVATLLDCPTGTIKTRMRDGLIRLRDCLAAAVYPRPQPGKKPKLPRQRDSS